MAFNGKQFKGIARIMRDVKRAEAEARNANTPHENTKAHRLDRCDCHEEGNPYSVR
jgi:hypothetical protein